MSEFAKTGTEPLARGDATYNKGYIYALVLNAALGAFFFGYVMSVFNPINDFVQNNAFNGEVPSIVLNFMTSFVPLGAAIGALIAGKVANLIGRRKSMIVIDLLAIVGTVLTLIPSEYTLLVGRLLQGFCVGANSSINPLYINEVAPIEITGSLGTYNQLLISTGVLVAPVLGLGMPTNVSGQSNNQYFRIMLLIAGVPAVLRLFFCFVLFRSETPKYLVIVGKNDEAKAILSKIYKGSRAQDELISLQRQNELQSEAGKLTLRDIVSRKYRKRLIIGVLIAIFQQFSGINAIIFFSNKIFGGGDDNTSIMPTVYTVIMDVLQLLTNIVSGLIIERFGRKLLFFAGMTFVTLLLLAFGIVCLFVASSPVLKFFIWGYMIGFGLSVGPIPWIYISDILPDVAIGIAVLANWLSAFVIGLGFPPIANSLGKAWGFIIFGAISVVGTAFGAIMMKETKGKTEAEITEMFSGKEDDSNNISAALRN